MATIKSPGTPPPGASFPLPCMLSCIPSSTPGGISISIIVSFFSNPEESTPGGLLAIICPDPLQLGQVEEVCIAPRIVLVTLLTCPVPLQVGQVENSTPFAATNLFTFIFF